MLDHRRQALPCDIGGARGTPRDSPVGKNQDRTLVDDPAHSKAARRVALDYLTPGRGHGCEIHRGDRGVQGAPGARAWTASPDRAMAARFGRT